MHELSIVQGILGIIEKERNARGFTRVKSVEVQCGHYSCISEESLKFCLEAVATEPHMKGAALKLVRMPARFRCGGCGAEFDALEALDDHLFRTHTGEIETHSYRCAACDAEFMAQAEWVSHLREGH